MYNADKKTHCKRLRKKKEVIEIIEIEDNTTESPRGPKSEEAINALLTPSETGLLVALNDFKEHLFKYLSTLDLK